MNRLIDASFARARTVLAALLLILIAGMQAYVGIPKEADPDVQIPLVYVAMTHDGISPEDAERLLVRPMEQELRAIEGVKEMRAQASEGEASVTLEFEAGVDIDEALADVREKVDLAKADLPEDTDEPIVNEVNLALFPVLVVTLAGDVPERALLALARDLEERIEGLADVLSVEIAGDREELLEVIIDPLLVESYGLQLEDLLTLVSRNNRLVAAGALDTGSGRFAVKVPGVFETRADVLGLPVKVEGDKVVRLGDIAEVRRTFKDAEGFARVGGRPALALEVSKRIGANIIDTVAAVRAVVEAERAELARPRRGRLPAGQVRRHREHADRPAEQRAERDPAGDDRDRRGARPALGRPRRARGAGLVPRRHAGARAARPDRQHRRAVRPDPRGRHAGRRRDRGDRARRPQDGRGPRARARPTGSRRSAWPGRSPRRPRPRSRPSCRCCSGPASSASS